MVEVVGSRDVMEFAVELARTGQSYALATIHIDPIKKLNQVSVFAVIMLERLRELASASWPITQPIKVSHCLPRI